MRAENAGQGVRFGDYSSFLKESETYTVSVNGQPVPAYRFDPMNDSSRVDFAWFTAAPDAAITVSAGETVSEHRIDPKTYGIRAEIEGSQLRFRTGSHHYLHVRINDKHTLILLADTKDYVRPDTSDESVLSITDFDVDPTGERDSTVEVQKALETASKRKGTLFFPAGVYRVQRLRPKSDTRIYLDFGAVIQAAGDAEDYAEFRNREAGKRGHVDFLHIAGQENVVIEGPGIVHANGIGLALSAGTPEPMPFPHGEIENVKMSLMTLKGHKSRNIQVRDILVMESTEWAITFSDCDQINVNNAKVINYANWFWSDGVHFTSCRDATAEDCYAYVGDDAYVTTTRVANAPTRNIIFRNNVAGFTTCTGLRAGWYARDVMDGVLFEDNVIISAGRGIDLLHYGFNGEPIRNITFRNTTIEAINDDGSTWQNRCPIFFEMRHLFTDMKEPGMISGVLVENLRCDTEGPHPSVIKSWGPDGHFSDVRFKNVEIAGRELTGADEDVLEVNEWSEKIAFE